MGLFSKLKIKPPAASLADLEHQLEQATEARAAADVQVSEAEREFDATGAAEALSVLQAARLTAAEAAEHVGRAERLLSAARAREEDARREELRAEAHRLDAELTQEALEEAARPLARREAELSVELATVRQDRAALAADVDAKCERRRAIALELDEEGGHGGIWIDEGGRARSGSPHGGQRGSIVRSAERVWTELQHLSPQSSTGQLVRKIIESGEGR